LLPRGVLPDVDQGAFRARLELEQGTPIERTLETAERLESLFLADPGVAAVFTQVGRAGAFAGIDAQDAGLHSATMEVRLRPDATTDEVVDRMRAVLSASAGTATGIPAGAVTIATGGNTALG